MKTVVGFWMVFVAGAIFALTIVGLGLGEWGSRATYSADTDQRNISRAVRKLQDYPYTAMPWVGLVLLPAGIWLARGRHAN